MLLCLPYKNSQATMKNFLSNTVYFWQRKYPALAIRPHRFANRWCRSFSTSRVVVFALCKSFLRRWHILHALRWWCGYPQHRAPEGWHQHGIDFTSSSASCIFAISLSRRKGQLWFISGCICTGWPVSSRAIKAVANKLFCLFIVNVMFLVIILPSQLCAYSLSMREYHYPSLHIWCAVCHPVLTLQG